MTLLGVPSSMKTPFSLAGKVALITGAASGIGFATAERFQKAGAIVFGIDQKTAPAATFPILTADVSDPLALEKAFDSVIRQAGRLHIVVNNAGIQPLGVSFTDLTPALIQRTLEINVTAVTLGHQFATRHLTAGGRILNTGSFVGTIGVPTGSIYAATKAAVIHLTRLAAVEFAARGITVNCVSPGTILTPAVTAIADNPEIPFMEKRTPLRRLGTPEEVAAAFHFLASEEASFITGINLPVDGGLTAGWEAYDLVPPLNVTASGWREMP